MAVFIGPAGADPLTRDAGRSHRKPAEVHISRNVQLGQFSEARVSIWVRCRPPWVVQELVINVSQEGASGSTAGEFGIVCDGQGRRIHTSVSTPGGGPFASGRTTVSAYLTVIDAITGDPGPQGQDTVTVWVPNQAEVKVSRDVRLGQGEAILATVFARCQSPWVPQDLFVEASQAEGTNTGSFLVPEDDVVCDGRWRRHEVQIFSFTSGFERGRTTVTASLSVLDPIDFDPVAHDTDSLTVWVNAPADVRIARHATLDADGVLLLPVWVRCQRPWVDAGLSVDIAQGANGGEAFVEDGLVCDGQWHGVDLAFPGVPDPFQTGSATAHAFFTVHDPISFDPVDQGQDTAEVQIEAA
jgi:hypothetical protein